MRNKEEGNQAKELQAAVQLHRALTADGDELWDLMREGSPEVLRVALKNPRLTEGHLQEALKRRLPGDLLVAIGRHHLIGACHRLKFSLVQHPGTPGPLFHSILPQLHLFELVTLTQHPSLSEEQKLAAERAIVGMLPATELGNKITLARRGSLRVLEALLRETEPRLLEAVLSNPRLKEPAVIAYLRRAEASAEIISAIARHPRWGGMVGIRRSLLHNRQTPAIWFTLFLPELRDDEVEELLNGATPAGRQRHELELEWEKRGHPPRNPKAPPTPLRGRGTGRTTPTVED